MDINIFLDQVLETLKTENILKAFSGLDPLSFLKDPYYLGGFIVVSLILFFLKFRKTLVFFFGLLVFWYAFFYFLPKEETLKLNDLFTFGLTCFGVIATWIYYFFIKGD